MTAPARTPQPSRAAHSLLLTAPRRLEWVAAALPALGQRDLLVETTAGSLSAGTELPHYLGSSRNVAPATFPQMTGYESVGVVSARGAAVRDIAVGDRIVATYGHRTRAIVPEARAIVVPPGLSDELALLTILGGDVATGIARLGDLRAGPALVTGAGAIGLLAVFLLRALGAPTVDVIEPRPSRRALARLLGAREALAPADTPPCADYAVGLECSSRDEAFALLQARMRPFGRICVVADGNLEPLTLTPEFHARQLTICGTSDCPDYAAHARWYFPLAARDPALAAIVDHTVAARDLPATFAALAAGELDATKVLVRYTAGM